MSLFVVRSSFFVNEQRRTKNEQRSGRVKHTATRRIRAGPRLGFTPRGRSAAPRAADRSLPLLRGGRGRWGRVWCGGGRRRGRAGQRASRGRRRRTSASGEEGFPEGWWVHCLGWL